VQEKKDIKDAGYDIAELVKFEEDTSPFSIGPNPKLKPKASKGAKDNE